MPMRADGVLAGHRIGHKQDLDRPRLALDPLELGHQLVVYVQTTGSVDKQRVEPDLLCVLHCTAHKRHRVIGFLVLVNRHAHGAAYNAKLLSRGGTVNVNRNKQRLALLVVAEPAGDLARRRRLARTLQAHQPDQLVVNDLYDLLVRIKALPNFLSFGLCSDRLDKVLRNLVVDIGFEQCHPYLAKRRIHMLGGQAPLATQVFQRFLQLVGQRFEHRRHTSAAGVETINITLGGRQCQEIEGLSLTLSRFGGCPLEYALHIINRFLKVCVAICYTLFF
jgi:hypothetical protein